MTPKSRWMQKADSAWYEYQHLVWKRCTICARRGVEIHHIITKGQKLTAYDIENGIGLCPDHHRGSDFSAHGTPAKFIIWLAEHRPKQYEYYQVNRNRHGYSLTIEYYKQAHHRIKELTRRLNEDKNIKTRTQ